MISGDIVQKTAEMVKHKFLGEGSGHDRWHIERVRKNALHIRESEGGERIVVELGALLHDIADRKFHGGDEYAGGRASQEWLASLGVEKDLIEQVVHIVDHISYKGAGVANTITSQEGYIVQDADRLDALGAIGIARTFAYGGAQHRILRDPTQQPVLHASAEAYKSSTGSTIDHFYEKLLLLKDRMNTQTGKQLAQERHQFMEQYLEQFFAEWQGEK